MIKQWIAHQQGLDWLYSAACVAHLLLLDEYALAAFLVPAVSLEERKCL